MWVLFFWVHCLLKNNEHGISMATSPGFAVVWSLSCVQLFATPWITYSTPGFPVLHYLPEFV